MLAGVRFVSQAELKELERKKAAEEAERDKARAELEEEKQQKRRERKEERRRKEETGELTWLAPGVERRFGSETRKAKPAESGSDDSDSHHEDRRRAKKRNGKHRRREGSPDSEKGDDVSDRKKKRGKHPVKDDGKNEDDMVKEVSGKSESTEDKPVVAKITREEAGLDWMTAPGKSIASGTAAPALGPKSEALDETTKLPGGETKPPSSSKELNPYWKTGGEGLPPEANPRLGGGRAKSAVGIGDGGASWRMKALKRAQEAAAREGKDLNEVVQERWDSLGQLTASVASGRAAPAYAHRFAQKDRERRGEEGRPAGNAKKGDGDAKGSEEKERTSTSVKDRGAEEHGRPERDRRSEEHRGAGGDRRLEEQRRPAGERRSDEHKRPERKDDRGYLRDVKSEKSQMRRPAESAPISWRGGARARPMREADAAVLRGAAAAMNQFPNDGNFLAKFKKDAQSKEDEAKGGEGARMEKKRASESERGSNGKQESRGVLGGAERGPPQNGGIREEKESARSALDEERAALRGMVAALAQPSESKDEPVAAGPVRTSPAALPQQESRPEAATRPSEPGTRGEETTAGLSANQAPGLNANQLAAKAMRLKLMGKTEEAEKLLKEAQKLRSVEVVTLPLVDAQGLAAPGAFGSAPIGGASERKPKRVQRYDLDAAGRNPDVPGRNADADGRNEGRPKVKPRFATEQVEEDSGSGSEEEKVPTGLGGLRSAGPQRARYFADDDEKDLKTIVAEAKRGRGADYDQYLAENIVKDQRFKGLADADGEYEHDDGLQMYESREKKGSQKKQAERFHSKQVADARRLQGQQDRCLFCFDNPGKPKHLIVSIGVKVYMMLPPRGTIVPGHCFIVPMAHEVASRHLDEDVWDEVRNFKKCLVKMWASDGKEVLFLETATQLQRQKRHCVVEAVPVPAGVASRQAPLYFKKALDEAESEWSQHNAKKIIDTRGKGLKASIPKNFPYFHVEFGLQGGYAHVIDDEAGWKASFGRDVIAGMLQLPEEDTHGRPKQQSFDQQRKAVLNFSQKWDPHDWTKMLG
ncbi:hypothetical protein KFL_000200160 [Klebsormidium nitens]|uniref:CWF19-like protein 2 n=1 Tax=Klebsormidium nitens TaxID=105231 RepID=A0A1Y1HJX9_KLENI|nr:hypothetical protein KFL_000200160 [Klebsormidium nitens]|eukprot:GAQ78864.1 hypothetical protein KFL_000200160 [Klebsormidium nitens]